MTLGIDLLRKAKVVVIPHLYGLHILDERHPRFVPCVTDERTQKAKGKKRKQPKDLVISTAALTTGLRHEEMTLLILFVEEDTHAISVTVLGELHALLSNYQGLLPA